MGRRLGQGVLALVVGVMAVAVPLHIAGAEDEPGATAAVEPTEVSVEPLVLGVGNPMHLGLLSPKAHAVVTGQQGSIFGFFGSTVTFSVGDQVVCVAHPQVVPLIGPTNHFSCPIPVALRLAAVLNRGLTGTFSGNGTYAPSTGTGGLVSVNGVPIL